MNCSQASGGNREEEAGCGGDSAEGLMLEPGGQTLKRNSTTSPSCMT
jgi:hypothetical protein